MIDSRQAMYDKANDSIFSSKPDLEKAMYKKIERNSDNEEFVTLLVNILAKPKIVVYHVHRHRPNVITFFKRSINTQGKREAEVVHIETGDRANKLWSMIAGED